MPGKNAKGKKGKRPDNRRPSRANYWTRKTLEAHKVRNLMRCCGMTRQDATLLWRKARTHRIKGQRLLAQAA